jgi:methylthioribose-1-phosphate isomerase
LWKLIAPLPNRFILRNLHDLNDAVDAISSMVVRGAPLIGAAAAYGLALAVGRDTSDAGISSACERLANTRPTAVNLRWALDQLSASLLACAPKNRHELAYQLAEDLCNEDVRMNKAIGVAGAKIITEVWHRSNKQKPVNILTHCNAGWLATVDWGTALAPIYRAFDEGVPIHVFVDETRPRNQGASLTAWELGSHGVPYTLIADNAGGHLMQQREIDLCIVGTDRVTADASVCNKIGTYLKALAAHDNNVPFYVALPSPTMDWNTPTGDMIPIEDRGSREVSHISGLTADGQVVEVRLAPVGAAARNPGFDVTPARLITGFLTDRGVAVATPEALITLFGRVQT